MPQRKELVTVTFVADHSTGVYHVGEPDGLIQEATLNAYLAQFGERGKNELIQHLAFLQHQVIGKWIRLQNANHADCCARVAEEPAATSGDTSA